MSLRKLFTTFLIALSLSIDDLAVGAAYGLQKIMLPAKPLLFMILGSTITMTLSMLVGKLFLSVFQETVSTYFSVALLIALGGYYLYKAWHENNACKIRSQNCIAKAHTVVNIGEAFYLGAALGIDDFAEAMGLAVAGFPVLLTVLLFKVAEVMMVLGGIYLGSKGFSRFIHDWLAYLPGIVLILVGFWQLK